MNFCCAVLLLNRPQTRSEAERPLGPRCVRLFETVRPLLDAASVGGDGHALLTGEHELEPFPPPFQGGAREAGDQLQSARRRCSRLDRSVSVLVVSGDASAPCHTN